MTHKKLFTSKKEVVNINTFFISDTHFGDDRIILYENRPFKDHKDFLEQFIYNWNNTVAPKDEVYHLGDFSCNLSKEENIEILAMLNGHKYLIMGNHDKEQFQLKDWYEIGFEKVYDNPIIINGFCILSHEPLYMSRNMPYVNVYGHVHGNPIYKDVSEVGFCVCCERIGWTPILNQRIAESIFKIRKEGF